LQVKANVANLFEITIAILSENGTGVAGAPPYSGSDSLRGEAISLCGEAM